MIIGYKISYKLFFLWNTGFETKDENTPKWHPPPPPRVFIWKFFFKLFPLKLYKMLILNVHFARSRNVRFSRLKFSFVLSAQPWHQRDFEPLLHPPKS